MSKLVVNTVVADKDAVLFSKSADSTFVQRLLKFIYGLDTEFPLSGGETDRELNKTMQYLKYEGHIFEYSAGSKFPLAGS